MLVSIGFPAAFFSILIIFLGVMQFFEWESEKLTAIVDHMLENGFYLLGKFIKYYVPFIGGILGVLWVFFSDYRKSREIAETEEKPM